MLNLIGETKKPTEWGTNETASREYINFLVHAHNAFRTYFDLDTINTNNKEEKSEKQKKRAISRVLLSKILSM